MASDELITVLAHSWLNSVSVVHAAAWTLMDYQDRLPADKREELLGLMTTQAQFLEGTLSDMIAAARPEVQAALDDLLSVETDATAL
jgi:hypothetical protein